MNHLLIFVTSITIYLLFHTYVFNAILLKINQNILDKYLLIGQSFLLLPTLICISLLIGFKYLWIILLIYLYYIFYKDKDSIFFKFNTKSFVIITLILIFSIQSIFVYFYDAINFVSMNHPDNLSNYNWSLFNSHGDDISYPPGLTGVIFPFIKIFELKYYLNYVGGLLGLISFLIIILTLRSVLSLKEIIILTSLLLSPIFNSLTVVRMGFHAGAIFQIIVISLFVFICYEMRETVKSKFSQIFNNFIYFLIFFQAGLLSPHQTLTLIPLVTILIIYLLVMKKINFRQSIYSSISILLGFLFSISYITRNKYNSIVNLILPSASPSLPSSPSLSFSTYKSTSFDNFEKLVKDFVLPTFPIRPFFESYLSIFSYLLFLIVFWLFIQSFRNRDYNLQILSIFSIYYIFVTQTGIFEFSYTKGRSGWNLMLLSAIVIVILFKRKINNIRFNLLFIPIILSLVFSILYPPVAYRSETEKAYFEIQNIARNNEINLFSDFTHLQIISENINVLESLSEKNMFNKNTYVLLNVSNNLPDKTKANIRRYEDRNFEKFFNTQKVLIESRIKKNNDLVKNLLMKNYRIIINDKDFIILRN